MFRPTALKLILGVLPPERAGLTPVGHGVALVVVGVVPLLGSLFRRRRD